MGCLKDSAQWDLYNPQNNILGEVHRSLPRIQKRYEQKSLSIQRMMKYKEKLKNFEACSGILSRNPVRLVKPEGTPNYGGTQS